MYRAGGAGEEEDESDEEEDDAGEGGLSLMDMLNANEAAAERAKGKGTASGGIVREESSGTAPASDDGDGSQDDEGENAAADQMEEEDVSAVDSEESDEDEDGDEEERHARLVDFVGSLGEQAVAAERAAEDRRSSQLLTEGEFNPTAVAGGGVSLGGGVGGKGSVTMEVRFIGSAACWF